RRDDAWECAIRGWNGTYTQSQQALIQQMQGLWKLMPNADARENAETVLEQVFGNRADAIKDKLNLDWLSVESDRMWNGPRELSADPSPPVSLQKRGPTVDETSPDSAAIGWRT
ncbi:MAG: hypothetical protein AB8G99_24365, partial [Planctomycetaceae bacterium]